MALRAAASNEDAMLGSPVGRALGLRGSHRPAINVLLCVFNGASMALRAAEAAKGVLSDGAALSLRGPRRPANS